jgi:transcriptional regulator with XRE-family HTH domain
MTKLSPASMSDELIAATLGSSIKALRKKQSLSLHEVSLATGISASFLSLVENGKSDMTIGRLVRLADLYGVDIDDLLPSSQNGLISITRPDQGRKVTSSSEGTEVSLLSPGPAREMTPMQLVFQPGSGLEEYGKHRGEEFVFVIAGELVLDIEGENPTVLTAGASAYYSGEVPHRFKNNSNASELRVLCVDSHNRWH